MGKTKGGFYKFPKNYVEVSAILGGLPTYFAATC